MLTKKQIADGRRHSARTPPTRPGVPTYGSAVLQCRAIHWLARPKAILVAIYGSPDKDWQDYQSLALYVPLTLPQGAIRTLIFACVVCSTRKEGLLWVWLVDREGEWVCFKSCWFADGVKSQA